MTERIEVTLQVDPEAASALGDPASRRAIEDMINRMFRHGPPPSPLAEALAATRAEARASGLTDDDIDAELAAYNAERRRRG